MSVAEDFEVFWKRYPRRIGKLAAEKEYAKARKRASAQELLDGIERYTVSKPSYADYCHPKTFLSQGRWLDELDVIPVSTWVCPHTPRCPHRPACEIVSARKAR